MAFVYFAMCVAGIQLFMAGHISDVYRTTAREKKLLIRAKFLAIFYPVAMFILVLGENVLGNNSAFALYIHLGLVIGCFGQLVILACTYVILVDCKESGGKSTGGSDSDMEA